MENSTAVVNQQIATIKKESAEVLGQVSSFKLKSQTDLERSNELLKSIGDKQKQIKQAKDFLVRPLKEHVKKIENEFLPIEIELKRVEGELKGQQLVYLQKVREEVAAKSVAISEKAEKGELDEVKAGQKILKQEAKLDNFKTMKIKKVVIENPQIVPDEYWVIDEVAVRRDALAGKQIAGVAIKIEEVIKK